MAARLHAPSQAVEDQEILGGNGRNRQGRDQDEPTGGVQRFLRRRIAGFAVLLACGAARGFSRRTGLPDRDRPRRKSGTTLARDPNRAARARASLVRDLVRIDGLSQSIRPAQVAPARPYGDVTALVRHGRDACGLRTNAAADADFALRGRDPVQLFAAMFAGRFETAEPFARKLERGMNPPMPLAA